MESKYKYKYADLSLRLCVHWDQLTKSYWFNFSERIHLKKPVVHIQYMDDGVMVRALDGTIFNGSYAILAIPPPANVSSDIRFTGPRVLSAY
jgi:monoamine oxidase